MHATLTKLIDRLDSDVMSDTAVIQWSCPVPSFGDLASSQVATLGLNPSNREFVDAVGKELQSTARRIHTLESLRLVSWSEADARHLRLILSACRDYFERNPYDRWFKVLDQVVAGTRASYYGRVSKACHLDLIPYATDRKWTELTANQRSLLLAISGDTLGLLLRESPVRVLILNGRSVVDEFQEIAGTRLDGQEMPSWSLLRRSRPSVAGVAYRGVVETLAGIELGRKLLVLGFNHNLQSSYGVTSRLIRRIRSWVASASEDAMR